VLPGTDSSVISHRSKIK